MVTCTRIITVYNNKNKYMNDNVGVDIEYTNDEFK